MRFLPEPVMPSNHGFSLVETFIGLALIALLLGFAVPTWQTQIIAKEVETASGHLFRDLQLARIEAIRRGVPVVLCPSEDGASCLWGGEWHKGWIGFEDPDRNQRREPAEAEPSRRGGVAQAVLLKVRRAAADGARPVQAQGRFALLKMSF